MRTTAHLLGSLLVLFSYCVLPAQTFTEISEELGIDYTFSDWNKIGGGVAFFDCDGDGDEDFYFTGGLNEDRLYRNNGDGTFTNITEGSGLEVTGTYFTVGVSVGDIDNDGFREIYVTTFGFTNSLSPERRDLLFKNNGDGTFQEIGALANISQAARSVSATFIDHDQDGYLDIHVVNYVDRVRFILGEGGATVGFNHECFENFFYHNNGNLTFTPVATELGLTDVGCGLAVTNLDFDQDGDDDIYTINDFGEFVVSNQVYLNNTRTGIFDRLMVSENDINIGLYGMGIAWSDYDLDQDWDFYVTNLGANALLNNDGNQLFTDLAVDAGVDNATTVNDLLTTSWGTAFADVDNDLYEDLFVSNGHIPAADFIATDIVDPNKLYLNNGDNTFSDISVSAGFSSPERARGLAYSDYDQDGDLDLFVNVMFDSTQESNMRLYRNDLSNDNNWVQLHLVGTQSNRDAIGAQIQLFVTDGPTLLRQISGGGSHASQNSTIPHFGLADHTGIDSIAVRWPNGLRETFPGLPINQRHTLIEATAPLVRIEFRLDMSFQETGEEGVFVEVTETNGDTTRHLMYSPFQNDQYNVFINRPPGFSGHYRFRNGNCADNACAEDLSEEGCGDPMMDYARLLTPITNDTIINACFGICPGIPCQSTVDSVQVDFSVNAITLDEELTPSTVIYLVGVSADDEPLAMADPDGDGRFDLSLTLPEDFSTYYTYTNGVCPDLSCAENLSGQGCTDEANDYFRFLEPLTEDLSLNACFSVCNSDSCFAPIDTFTLQINLNMINEELNPTGVFVVGDYFGLPGASPLFDGNSDGIFTSFFEVPENVITYFSFSNGSNCPDNSCLEDLNGQSCAHPDEDNFRLLGPLTADTVLDFCFGNCELTGCVPTPDSIDVTFNVNMDPVDVSMDGVYWLDDFSAPGNYPMEDLDGDNIYSITLRQPEGYTDYYSIANGLCPDLSCREDISGQECADPFELNYRLIESVYSDTIINLCFGSCETDNCVAPIDSVEIQFNLNMVFVEPSLEGVYLVEGLFGAPGTYELLDPEGDDIYTVTVRQPEGFSSFYSFANGNCPDLSCDEDLTGQDCGPPNAANNRWLPPVGQDTIINTCFGYCIPDFSCPPPQPTPVTFGFHDPLNEETAIFLNGDFGLLEDDFTLTESFTGSGEWSVTVEIFPGTYQYRFGIGNPGDGVLEAFSMGQADTCTIDVSGERFRTVIVEDLALELEPVCFELCFYCEDIIDNVDTPEARVWTFQIQPNPASEQALVSWEETASNRIQMRLINAVGQVIKDITIPSVEQQFLLDTKSLPSGFYLLQLEAGERQAMKKLIVR